MSKRSFSRRAPKHVARGAAAGAAAGLAASWLMNVFIAKAGSKLTEPLLSEQERAREQEEQRRHAQDEDATMKAADAIVHAATSGGHLSHEARQKGGPLVHYAFGALMGGVYGALAAYWPAATAGFGTVFGAALYAGADLAAVPALNLAPAATEQPLAKQGTPFAAHLVYGATTDLLRRALLRAA
jgi:putative membrane protein